MSCEFIAVDENLFSVKCFALTNSSWLIVTSKERRPQNLIPINMPTVFCGMQRDIHIFIMLNNCNIVLSMLRTINLIYHESKLLCMWIVNVCYSVCILGHLKHRLYRLPPNIILYLYKRYFYNFIYFLCLYLWIHAMRTQLPNRYLFIWMISKQTINLKRKWAAKKLSTHLFYDLYLHQSINRTITHQLVQIGIFIVHTKIHLHEIFKYFICGQFSEFFRRYWTLCIKANVRDKLHYVKFDRLCHQK